MHSGIRAAGPIDRLANPVSEAGQRGFEFPLDRPDPGPLGLEAGEVRAVIFNPGAIPTSGRRLGGALSGPWFAVTQTSSIWTIGAASPLRRPIFTIRV
jgi:hypothetical protein